MLTMLQHPLDVLGLELNFTAEVDNFGEQIPCPLFEGGSYVNVTDENKEAYVQLMAHHRMTTRILSLIHI